MTTNIDQSKHTNTVSCNFQGVNYVKEDIKKIAKTIANFFINEVRLNYIKNLEDPAFASASYILSFDFTKQENAKKVVRYLESSESVANESSAVKDLIVQLSNTETFNEENYNCSTHPSADCLDSLLWDLAMIVRDKATKIMASFANPHNICFLIGTRGDKLVEVQIMNESFDTKINFNWC